jgi:CelD/BcsL family acetyltransferase involved in cellulose biosynthesis
VRAFSAPGAQRRAELLAAGDPAWRAFVLDHPAAFPYHHPAWTATITDAYGFEPFAFAVRDASGAVVGGVPFVSIGGRVRRKRWVALPFTDACPPLTTPGLPTETLASLVSEAREERGVAAVEIRGPLGSQLGAEAQRGVVHTLELSSPDELFSGFQSQVRRNIRKAERSDLSSRLAETEDDLTSVYFRLHADTRRRLGVPTQPRRFFEAVWRQMMEPGLGFTLLAYHGDTPVAGAVFLEWNGRIIYKFGASDHRHWALRPNNLIFWEAIRQGCERGAKILDFGRSDMDDEGLRAFKRSWGAVEEPLVYTTLGRAKDEAGAGSAERLLKPLLRRAPTWVGRGLGQAFYRFTA